MAALYRILNKKPYRPAVELDKEATGRSRRCTVDDAHLTAAAVVVRYVVKSYDCAPKRSRCVTVICAVAARIGFVDDYPTIGKSPRLIY